MKAPYKTELFRDRHWTYVYHYFHAHIRQHPAQHTARLVEMPYLRIAVFSLN